MSFYWYKCKHCGKFLMKSKNKPYCPYCGTKQTGDSDGQQLKIKGKLCGTCSIMYDYVKMRCPNCGSLSFTIEEV